MGKIGCGYGSEWHLLRYLGYHRQLLQDEIIRVTKGENIRWLDFGFSGKNEPRRRDRELQGFEFLDASIQGQWKGFWPQRGNVHNWDAVGRLSVNDREEWLLVEAKSHVDELYSSCGARSLKSRNMIMEAFGKAMGYCCVEGVSVERWLEPHYQFCNRLAALNFLSNECDPPVDACLVMIYFYGDKFRNRRCPETDIEWETELRKVYREIGLKEESELLNKVRSIFLPVNPQLVK